MAFIKSITPGGASDEIREFIRAKFQIRFIKHSLRETPEKTRRAIFQDPPARTEQRRVWREAAAERQQIVFISARAVQQQQRQTFRLLFCRNETVNKLFCLRNHDSCSSSFCG